ncbi:MAG: NACHT domain-containing protein, partial [Planctomycetaceae bacterium]
MLTDRRRLCVSEDAGAGKSVLTRRVLSFACTEAGQRAVFGGKPGLVLRFEQWEHDWPRDFSAAIEQALQRGCAEAEADVDLKAMTGWLLNEGRVLLLLDGLDQVQNDGAIAAVSEFLTGEGRNCRAIVTGRPYRIDQSRGNLLRSTEWRFARIEGFDDEQVDQYLRGFAVKE